MFKCAKFLLIITIVLASCQTEKPVLKGAEDIFALQKMVSEQDSDSAYYSLLKVKRMLADLDNPELDSAGAVNDHLLGQHFMEAIQYDSAAYYFEQACNSVTDEVGNEQETQYFRDLYQVNLVQGKYGVCLNLAKRFKSLIDSTTDVREMAVFHYFEGTVHYYSGDYEKAIESTHLREEMVRQMADTVNLIDILVFKAYFQYYHQNDLEGTFRIFNEMLKSVDHLPSNYQSRIYAEYGVYQFWDQEYEKAIDSYRRSIYYQKKVDDHLSAKKDNIANGYSNIAEAYMELKEYDQAAIYLDSVSGLDILTIRSRIQQDYWKLRLNLNMMTRNQAGSNQYLDTLFTLQNKQLNSAIKDQIAIVNKANENEKRILKEKQAVEVALIKRNLGLTIGVISFVVVVLALMLFYRQRKSRFEQESLNLQQRLFRSQMNPHFTFNIMYAIQNMIGKDPAKASQYLVKFSRLLRLILENSLSNYVVIGDELESLRKYMDLQLFRFPGKFSYEIIFENLEADDPVFIPPMLMQPIVENSIEHGFQNINYEGVLTIRLSMHDKYITCEIEDNGTGLTDSGNVDKNSTSTGLVQNFLQKAVKSKMNIINKKENGENLSGLITKFQVPYKLTAND